MGSETSVWPAVRIADQLYASRQAGHRVRRFRHSIKSNLLRRLRLEFDDVVTVNHVPNLYRAATDFAVFDICLASNRHIEDDRDLLAAVRTSEEVFHKFLVWY